MSFHNAMKHNTNTIKANSISHSRIIRSQFNTQLYFFSENHDIQLFIIYVNTESANKTNAKSISQFSILSLLFIFMY